MEEKEISNEEINVYDRQIRLWGIQAQKRIRNSSVLLVHIRELAEEIAKNLVLSGIGTLTLLDDKKIEKVESTACFSIGSSDIGTNYADAVSRALKEFNPSVTLQVNTTPLSDVPDNYFSAFDIVIATELELDLIVSTKESRATLICKDTLEHNMQGTGSPLLHLCNVRLLWIHLCRSNRIHIHHVSAPAFSAPLTPYRQKKVPGCLKKATTHHTEHYYPFSQVINHKYGEMLTEKHRKKVSPLLPGILGRPPLASSPPKGLLSFQKSFCRLPATPDEISHYLSLARLAAHRLALSDQTLADPALLTTYSSTHASHAPPAHCPCDTAPSHPRCPRDEAPLSSMRGAAHKGFIASEIETIADSALLSAAAEFIGARTAFLCQIGTIDRSRRMARADTDNAAREALETKVAALQAALDERCVRAATLHASLR
ncbi:hypothetical protein PMAC_000400 [Pneumocystis sp. 'macacae']|nr:hypothetical protein PMAC_000400 [Pneumocystis sp. 'macacae']